MGLTVAVVLAGGRGKRVGAGRNKVLIDVAGRPVIAWSIAAFAEHPAIDRVVLVGHPDDLDELREVAAKLGVDDVIAGGAERPDSERNALHLLREQVADGSVSAVLIHDGARPCVSAALIARAAETAQREGVVPVLEAPPLVTDSGDAIAAPPGHLMRAQTPQGGPAAWLVAAYDAARHSGFTGTDTASYLEHAGYDVRGIAGDEANLKVTYAADLERATRLLTAG